MGFQLFIIINFVILIRFLVGILRSGVIDEDEPYIEREPCYESKPKLLTYDEFRELKGGE